MAETVSSVGTSKDYTTVIAWEAAAATSISSGDQVVAELYGTVTDTAQVEFGGWTYADTTARAVIRPASGEEHGGVYGGGALMERNVGNNFIINDEVTNLTIDGVEMHNTGAKNIFIDADPNVMSIIVKDCLLDVSSAGSADNNVNVNGVAAGGDIHIYNTVARGGQRGFYTQASTSSALVRIDFCLSYLNTLQGYVGIQTVKNCVSLDCTTDFDTTNFDAASDYLVSSDTSSNTVTNYATGKTAYTDYYTDPANGNFNLKNNTQALWGLQGTTISGITTDFVGVTRDTTNPDIGPAEYDDAAAPPVTTNVTVDPSSVTRGTSVALSADITADETITAAEYITSNVYPVPTAGNGTAMSLGAGTTSREATATIDTSTLPQDTITVSVRGYDAVNGWGDLATAELTVATPTPVLGTHTLGASTWASSSNRLIADGYTASEDGTVQSITLQTLVDCTQAGNENRMCLYKGTTGDSNTVVPNSDVGDRLADEVIQIGQNRYLCTWNYSGAKPVIESGVEYGVSCTTGPTRPQYTSSGGEHRVYSSGGPNPDSPPADPAGTPDSSGTFLFTAYVTYTEGIESGGIPVVGSSFKTIISG